MPKLNPRLESRIAIAACVIFLGIAPPSVANSVAYGYDPNGRLASALYDSGTCVAYTYDENGNRTSQNPLTAPTNPVWGSATWGCLRWTSP